MFYDKKLSRFVDKTNQIQWYSEDDHACRVKFYGRETFYPISYSNIHILQNPKQIELSNDKYFNGHKLQDYKRILKFGSWIKVFYDNKYTRVFHESQISTHSSLIKQGSNNILRFNYYMELAKESALHDNDFLSSMYDKLDFIQNDSILSKYLKGDKVLFYGTRKSYIYPFGLNISQKKAVENAFSYDISVIEGPPGTGKTQTILNIIANAVMHKKSVAVVSNNNAAIQNVKDKLAEYNLDFLVALLGNKDNKSVFFDETIHKEKPLKYLSYRTLKDTTDRLYELVTHYEAKLPVLYNNENKLANLLEKKHKYELEYSYYMNEYEYSEDSRFSRLYKNIKASNEALFWKAFLENAEKLSWFQKFKLKFLYKIRIKDLTTNDIKKLLTTVEHIYYKLKISELGVEIKSIEEYLSKEDFEKAKSNYELVSMELLKRELSTKYKAINNMDYTYENYRSNFNSFIKEYPVILSTSYALMPSAESGFYFDYLIIDEASQTDILSSILAMSCAKNMIVVGDTKQLPQIDVPYLAKINKELKESYKISNKYDYFNNIILTSVLGIFINVPKVLLKEHYRCHPDIINFCNQKFYNNELIVMTSSNPSIKPLHILKTVPGNHARSNPNGSGMYNQREIDEIELMIKDIKSDSIGVITPYRYQADLMGETLKNINKSIEVDTVHKFQGRAKDYIILSTVANEVRFTNATDDSKVDFVARSDLLNVAVSRAKKQLTLVVSDKVFNSKNNSIADLIKYIRYNSPGDNIDLGNVKSIYDILYVDYQEDLIKYRRKHNKKDIISELITLDIIKDVMKEFKSFHLGVIMHYPLNVLVKDLSKLTEKEINYVSHSWSHVDFTIFNSLTKEPVLIIEVDGISYHEQNETQSIRDEMKNKAIKLNAIPLLRLKTNESNEKNRIKEALKTSLLSQ